MIIAVAAIVISVLSMAVSAYQVVVLRRTQRRRAEWLSPYNVEEMAKRARRRAAGPAVSGQSAPVHPNDFTRALQAAGLVENSDRITEIKIIATPDELVTIQVTYLADQRVLTLADSASGPGKAD